ASIGYRHRLDLWLRIPGLSGRPDVLCRSNRAEDHLRGHSEVSAAGGIRILDASSIAGKIGQGRAGFLWLTSGVYEKHPYHLPTRGGTHSRNPLCPFGLACIGREL